MVPIITLLLGLCIFRVRSAHIHIGTVCVQMCHICIDVQIYMYYVYMYVCVSQYMYACVCACAELREYFHVHT